MWHCLVYNEKKGGNNNNYFFLSKKRGRSQKITSAFLLVITWLVPAAAAAGGINELQIAAPDDSSAQNAELAHLKEEKPRAGNSLDIKISFFFVAARKYSTSDAESCFCVCVSEENGARN